MGQNNYCARWSPDRLGWPNVYFVYKSVRWNIKTSLIAQRIYRSIIELARMSQGPHVGPTPSCARSSMLTMAERGIIDSDVPITIPARQHLTDSGTEYLLEKVRAFYRK